MPTIDNAGARLYYEPSQRPTGSAPDLVFAHGAGGNTLSWWQQTPCFDRSHRVLRFDHRLFGRSSCAPDDFQPRLFESDLIAILDDAGIERAALVCQSMGGWTGLRTAVRHPERVSALVLCGTPGGVVTRSILEAASRVGNRTTVDRVVASAALAAEYTMRDPAMAGLYHQISCLNERFDPKLLVRLYEPEARVSPEECALVEVPVLILRGEHDALFPLESMREIAALLPGAETAEFEDAGHSVYFERADDFNRILARFLQKHGA